MIVYYITLISFNQLIIRLGWLPIDLSWKLINNNASSGIFTINCFPKSHCNLWILISPSLELSFLFPFCRIIPELVFQYWSDFLRDTVLWPNMFWWPRLKNLIISTFSLETRPWLTYLCTLGGDYHLKKERKKASTTKPVIGSGRGGIIGPPQSIKRKKKSGPQNYFLNIFMH